MDAAAQVQNNNRSLYLDDQNKRKAPSQEMGKDQFLQILVTQLQNQDPLNPMEDKDFIAQMATFSSLEQMMNISKSIDTLVQSQLVSPVIKYSHMIGKTVTYPIIDEETGKVTGSKSGTVVSVSQQDGWAILELSNGEKIYADAIQKVSDEPPKTDEDQESESEAGESEPAAE